MEINLKGTGVALVTPFNSRNEVDINALKKIVRHTINGKVDYLVILGTTGETPVLTDSEKQLVIATIVEENNNEVPLILGVGGNSTFDVVKKIKKVSPSQISAILSVSPYYNKPTQEGIYKHYATLEKQSEIPIIIYNVPSRTSSNIEAETTLRLSMLNNIIAVKEASGSIVQSMNIINKKPNDFKVISGDDIMSLPLISCGAEGVISVIANAFPATVSSLINCALANNLKKANEYHYKLLEIIEQIFIDGNPAGVKYILSKLGLCQNYLRLPLLKITKKTEEKINQLLKQKKLSLN